jgi:hypothetical protein
VRVEAVDAAARGHQVAADHLVVLEDHAVAATELDFCPFSIATPLG